MRLRRLLTPLLAACLYTVPIGLGWADEKKVEKPAEKPAEKPMLLDTKSIDKDVFTTLRTVINEGVDLYNNGDLLGCYRLYQGALTAYKPVLVYRPNLQKEIDAGLADARTAPNAAKAFILRKVIDQIRVETNPNPMAKPATVQGTKPETVKPKTLFEKLGGDKGIAKIADDFVTVAEKPPVNLGQGGKVTIDASYKAKWAAQLTSAAGGKVTPAQPLVPAGSDFNALLKDLEDAAKKNGAAPEDARALAAAIATMKKDLVEPKKESPPKPTTLWDKLGGEKVVSLVVDDFFDGASKDPKVNLDRNGMFKREGAAAEAGKKKLVAWISSQTGGPIKYTGLDMKAAHAGMKITSEEFDATGKHLAAALKKNAVNDEASQALLAVFLKFKADVVEAKKPAVPEPAAKLWDRLGGEPVVRKVIDDFVNTALADTTIKFYGDAKPTAEQKAKLKNNLVELISTATEGPLKYTGKDMKEAHKGMKITEAQFDAAAKHLEVALKLNKVKEDDAKALMEIVGKTKKEIVEKK